MQLGSFSHQVALAVPMAQYYEFSMRINPLCPDPVVADEVGYLIVVARGDSSSNRTWEVLLAGSRDQVLQPGLLHNDGSDVLGQDLRRLEGWFHTLVDTAVPVEDISLESVRDVWLRLEVSAQLLKRISALPMTTPLRSEGAFDAERSLISLDAETTAGLARRLAWLLELSNEARPVFQPVNGPEMERFGLYLSRLHGKQIKRQHR